MESNGKINLPANGEGEHPPSAEGGDNVDPATPWLQYLVNSVQRRAPIPTAKMPADRNDVYYNMNHKHRGIAIIFNHENFESRQKLKSRSGTQVDFENLQRSLKELGFQAWPYHDCKTNEVMDVLTKAAAHDHSDNDCLVVAVLTHGELGVLFSNDSVYKAETLWTSFTADKCPTLAGKPKLFFIQACQGDSLDGGIHMMRTETDSGSCNYKIPVHSDFLIAYSTIPGYYSWRNTSKGSWFMQALCEELNQNGFLLDLLTILTFVNQRVAIDYESNTPDTPAMHQQKQIPCITFMLTRLVKFTRKSGRNSQGQ